jgi:hypothetical protein
VVIGLHPTGRRAAYLALGGFALVIVVRLAVAGGPFAGSRYRSSGCRTMSRPWSCVSG